MARFPLSIFKNIVTSKSTYSRSETAKKFMNSMSEFGFTTGMDCLGSVSAALPADKEIYKRYKPYNIMVSTCLDDRFEIINEQLNYVVGKISCFSGREVSGNLIAIEKIPIVIQLAIAASISKNSDIYNNIFFVSHNYSKFGYGGIKAAVDKINPLVYIKIGTKIDTTNNFYGKGFVLNKEPYSNDKLLDYLYKVSINNGIYVNKNYTQEIQEEISIIASRKGGIPCASIEVPIIKNNRGYYKAKKEDILNVITVVSEFIRGSVLALDYLPGV